MNKRNPNRPFSLTLRVTFLVGLVISLSLIVLSLLVHRSMNNHFTQQDVDELNVVVDSVAKALTTTNLKDQDFHKKVEKAVSGHHGVYFLVADEKRMVLFKNSQPDLKHLLLSVKPVTRVRSQDLFSWTDNDAPFHGAVVLFSEPRSQVKYLIAVAASTSFHLDYLKRFEQNSWLVLLVALVTTFIASWFAVQLGHKPLTEMTLEIRSIDTAQLNRRLKPESYPVELQGLTQELNQMLTRIEQSYARLSHFSSDIAHELRTPVTNLMTQTQVALSKSRSIESYREILYSNLEEYERLAIMVSDMLFLAKSDNGLLVADFVTLNLNEEILDLYDYFDALAHEKNLTLTIDSCNPSVIADRAMLKRALSNLYLNAIRYCKSNSNISTKIKYDNGCVMIHIENNGDEIPKKHLDKIFDRFYQVDSARKNSGDGVGLGLAITRSIIQLHQGQITVQSNNSFTRFTIKLISPPNTIRV